ncbi:hypothetical protein JWG42_16550 [Desulfoprunum benzoelyticum]|uniref:Uncharacterized protein n=1 Tax=Desulfoprunum benzoelyticum TaxID=1506996 RepID=A0A840V155_9BACT|nr:hypothetical protein [Desulfoprunum benzoelyticum]MBB5347550.1 hypothetical protein [Desulfoprunum benzoelyticum]MBM9531770.1 hypothetical protein [Desulfoprunum benzoelyticum]
MPLPPGFNPYTLKTMDAYTEAHLFVAAVRILQHRNQTPPRLEDVCEMLQISVELGHSICRRLAKAGIIETLEDPFSIMVAVADHLRIEKIPRQTGEENSLARDLQKFQAGKKSIDQKVAELQAEMAKKKKALFADVEAMFKKGEDKGGNV